MPFMYPCTKIINKKIAVTVYLLIIIDLFDRLLNGMSQNLIKDNFHKNHNNNCNKGWRMKRLSAALFKGFNSWGPDIRSGPSKNRLEKKTKISFVSCLFMPVFQCGDWSSTKMKDVNKPYWYRSTHPYIWTQSNTYGQIRIVKIAKNQLFAITHSSYNIFIRKLLTLCNFIV